MACHLNQSAFRRQVHGCIFATTINLDIKADPVAFFQALHPGAFDRRDMDKNIGLAIVTLDETKTLHGVEEFDGACTLFTSQFARGTGTARCATTKAAATITAAITTTITAAVATITAFGTIPPWGTAFLDRHRFAIDLDIGRRNPATAINHGIVHRLAIGEAGQAGCFDCRNMDENIGRTVVRRDEAKALLRVEKFDRAAAFANHLGWHLWTSATAAAAAAKSAAAAAEAITATTATAAKAITAAAAAETVTTATAAKAVTASSAITAVTAETVKTITSAPTTITATPFIETHNCCALSKFVQIRVCA
jgi:hypothetical protein